MRHSGLIGAFGLALLAASCGSADPIRPTTPSPRYDADLDSCSTSVPQAVQKRNAKTGLSWFASPVTRWSQIGDGVAACMEAKGWGRTRPCTEPERRQVTREGNLVVTASGLQCRDPGKPP